MKRIRCALLTLLVYDMIHLMNAGRGAEMCEDCTGCMLVVNNDMLERAGGDVGFPTNSKTHITNVGEQEKMKAAFKAFGELALEVAKLNGAVDAAVTGYGIFTTALGLVQRKKQSTWEKVEMEVDQRIQHYTTYQHFNDETFWDRLKAIAYMCPEKIGVNDLREVMVRKYHLFPQNHATVSFTPRWVADLNTWLMFVVAVYLEMIKRDKAPKCSLNDELSVLQGDVKNALKSLSYKRWYNIHGRDILKVSPGDYTRLRFLDTLTDTWFPSNSPKYENNVNMHETEDVVFNKVNADTYQMTKALRERFNALAQMANNLFDDCTQIDDITWQQAYHNVPPACYGTPKDSSEKPCVLPCDSYGRSGENICPNDHALEGNFLKNWAKGGTIGDDGDINNAFCNPVKDPGFAKCAPVPKTKTARAIENIRQFGDKKKKAKKAKKDD